MEITPQSEPLQIFESWMKEAKARSDIQQPTAMTLATSNRQGELSTRVVLCKGWSPEGFVFYTNYHSRKGRDLAENPNMAAVFYWDALFRQVEIRGAVEKTPRQTSEAYWVTRPRESQISQYVSRQSQPAPSREHLDAAWQAAELEFRGRAIPCPDNWGGYLIRPKAIEFWIGRPGRFHDRHVFEKAGLSWTYKRLYP